MSQKTGIEWATHTASPWFGCSKVSAGCTNCYAEFLTLQKKWAGWGDNAPRVRSKGFWKDAYRYDRAAEKANSDWRERVLRHGEFQHEEPERPRMFTSLMDWLDPKAPLEWFTEFVQVVIECQNLDWLLLTKRPELWRGRIHKAVTTARPPAINYKAYQTMLQWFNGTPPANVWFGATVENQEMANLRIPQLLRIPARIRWLSVEPLLEQVSLDKIDCDEVCQECHKRVTASAFSATAHCDCCVEGDEPIAWGGLHWVVVGGESGSKRRDCGVNAIGDVVCQCVNADIPCFVKQDCAQKPGQQGRIPNDIWAYKQFPK